jgi:hypothetical protein
MSPLLVRSEAASVRHDRRLVRSLPSRSSSREGGTVAELNLRRPRAADDEGGDADTDADDLSGLSFKASLLRSPCLRSLEVSTTGCSGTWLGTAGSRWMCARSRHVSPSFLTDPTEVGIALRPAPPPTAAYAASEHPPRASGTGQGDAIASSFSGCSRSSASTTA